MLGASRALPVLLALACLGCDPQGPSVQGPDAGRGTRHRAPAPELAESEPNDGPQQATPFQFTPTAPGSPLFKPLLGSLASSSDVDWISVDAQGDRPVRRLVVTPLDDADVAILWPAGEGAITDLAQPGAPEIVENLAGSSPVQFAVIQGREGGPGRYRVEIARSDVDGEHLEAEAGDAKARLLNVPGQVQGVFNHGGDRDGWTVSSPQGPFRLEYVPPPSVGSRLSLKKGEEAAAEYLIPPGEPGAAWVRPNLGAGVYHVALTLTSDVPGAQGAYSLRAVAHPPAPDNVTLEVEPNDPANPLRLNAPGIVHGYLHDGDDTDSFVWEVGDAQVEPTAPWIVRAGFGARATAARLAVVSGDVVLVSEAKNVCNRVVQPGALRVTVSPEEKAQPQSPLRYQLAVEVHQAKGEEIEPNAERLEASALQAGAVSKGFLHPEGDVDHWVFDVAAPPGGDVGAGADVGASPAPSWQFRLTSPGVDAQMELLDEDGALVARTNRRGTGGTEKLSADLPAGRYFVVVKGATPQSAACTRPYTLEFSRK